MAKKRKVKVPVKERKRQQAVDRQRQQAKHYTPQTDIAAQAGRRSSKSGCFMALGILGAVVVLAALVVVGLEIMRKRELSQREPWTDYQERIETTPTTGEPVREYVYPKKEVAYWVAGVRSATVSEAQFGEIAELVAEWLDPVDSTRVLIAANQAHPEWRSALVPHAKKLLASTNSADPDLRERKNLLSKIVEAPEGETPAAAPAAATEEMEPAAEPEVESMAEPES